MSKLPEPKTKNPNESVWDRHSDYQWGYFIEEVKYRITYFLEQRLTGKNVELGGGWFLSHPGSTVVDLSSVALSHNPAEHKVQFDLDTIGQGQRLPFTDNSFQSATLISVWQYLQHPKAIVAELERILKPGGELYLIHGQGAGLEECIKGFTKTEEIQEFFKSLQYDTIVETIPTPSGKTDEFKSVCVAMPDEDLFGKQPSQIANKKTRRAHNRNICEAPAIFNNSYTN